MEIINTETKVNVTPHILSRLSKLNNVCYEIVYSHSTALTILKLKNTE